VRTKSFFVLLGLTFTSVAFGHASGHGPEINGKGPNGGALTAVIAAKDADLGAKAAPVAIAEWVKSGETIELQFLTAEGRKPMPVPAATVKWIVLGAEKPVVISTEIKAEQPKLAYTFAADVLAKGNAVEVIIPGLTTANEKQVLLVRYGRHLGR
jgi:hypothetical protein